MYPIYGLTAMRHLNLPTPRRCAASLLLLAMPIMATPGHAQQTSDVPEQLKKRTEEMLRRLSPGGQRAGKDAVAGAEQAMYQYLISEIAGQRGRHGIAIQGMTDLARKTRDPRLARRALEIAFQSRQFGDAMDAASLWVELEPESALARQAMSVLLANSGTLETATKNLAVLLAERDKAPTLYLQVNQLLSRFADKKSVLAAVQQLAKVQPDLAQSHFAVAQAAAAARDPDLALSSAREAVRIDSKFQRGVVLQAQLLNEKGAASATELLRDYLAANPDAAEVRLAYARLLVSQRAYPSAREEFRRLEQALPRDPEFPYAIGLIDTQMGALDDASAAFQRALALGLRDKNPVLMSLGQVEERRKNWDAALKWYGQLSGAEYFVNAKLKMASVLAKQQGLEQGRKFLQDVDAESAEQRVHLVLAEAQLLRDAKAFKEAHALLTTWLEQSPDSTELLYDRAMVAEKLGDIAGLERDLRRVIQLKPDYAHAYNALGYTLADRTTRYPEARELIEKAITLAPDDAFILDSLGWVQFRQGQIEAALKTLKDAYAKRSDPEIAAHLGEVLWAAGSRDEASQLWRAALAEHPDNDALTAVLQRYRP